MAAMLQIPRVFPRVSCLGSAKAVQCLRPGLEIGDKKQQIPRYSPYVPRVNPPEWLLISALCMFTSQEQVSPPSLGREQNPFHLFVGILFKFTALEILLI